jgi:hypothetical protein
MPLNAKGPRSAAPFIPVHLVPGVNGAVEGAPLSFIRV